MDNKDILIWLNSLYIANKTVDKLQKYFVDLRVLWEISDRNIKKIEWLKDKEKDKIIKTRNLEYIKKIKEKLKEENVKTVTIFDDEYSTALSNIYNPPKVLYIKGNLKEEDSLAIAIVGSRKATSYGKWVAEKISRELSRIGITIISGMARGIDTQAHKGAIGENGRTIGVLGCGVNIVYPKRNKELSSQIVHNGALISEFFLDTPPLSQNFPLRNRIISGLSLGVAVIEAGEKSGSLITAEHALEQGKDVFAVPGNINSIYSKGTNQLIKEGAKVLTDVDDILEEIYQLREKIRMTSKNDINFDNLSEDEAKIIKCIQEYPLHCDNIVSKTKMNICEVNSILTILEMKGIIKQLPGKIFTIK